MNLIDTRPRSVKQVIKAWFSVSRLDMLLRYLTLLIIFVGVLLRLIVLLNNYCFILDEVNVALNIYERDVLQLFTPLNYNQYAPPGFLVVTKVFTEIFGYSEHFFRLYAFLSGVLSLWVFVLVLKRYVSFKVIWYPLFIIAVGFIYIRYSVSVKQYSGDMLITLLLILLALKKDITLISSKKFVVLWTLAGTIAIWFSMPSVFVLTSIGLYFFMLIVQQKEYKKIYPLAITGILWLLNFAVYFQILLRQQIGTGYLQIWHDAHFLNFLPFDKATWEHNWELVRRLLFTMGGSQALSIIFHILMMLLGVVYYIRKYSGRAMLIILPLVLCLIAVFFHKYTMIERVMLFALPLILILIAGGMQVVFNMKSITFKLVTIACGIICIINFSEIDTLDRKMQHEELTLNMKYVVDMGVTGDNLYVSRFAIPAFKYYTTIHPGKDRWITIKKAKELPVGIDFEQFGMGLKERTALLYGFEDWSIIEENIGSIRKHAKDIGYHNVPVGWVSVFAEK